MGAILLLALGISLRAEQSDVVLSASARVRLEIAAPGAPPDARVELWTSVGRVEEVRRESPDLFSAVYLPPPEMLPRVALLRATLQAQAGSARGWLALPLIARAVLPVQTKPGSRVEVGIGGVVFGPVHADASGTARVAVKIPPGARTARVRVRDPFGNVNETPVDLRPPPFQRLSLLALREQASWADAQPVPLQIFAVSADGRPASAADLTVSCDRGRLGEVQELQPGLFEVAFRAPDRADGAATVRAALLRQQPETAAIALVPGPAAQIRLTATPAELREGGDLRVEAHVLDARGNPVPGGGLRFWSDGGELVQDGATAALHVAPDRRGEIHLFAAAGGVQASIAVPLRSANRQQPIVASEEQADRVELGALLGGQSNFSRASAAAMQAEVSVHTDLGVELLARAGLLKFAAAREGAATSDLRGVSLLAGARASLPIGGDFAAHLAVLGGALRTFGSLAVSGGAAGGFTQPTAEWGMVGTAALGASLRLGRGRAIAELQLSRAPGSGDLSGNLGGAGVCVGYLFALR
ncbi:MAG TPA: hypothetical protein VI356_20730 [Myxococcales bacterium]